MSGSKPEPTAATESEAAYILGLQDRSSIAGYIRRGCPGGKGVYPLVQMRDWIKANIRQDGRGARQEKSPDQTRLDNRLGMAELLKAEAEAMLRQVKLRSELGELVERAVVEAALRVLFNAIRHRIQALPAEIGQSMPAEHAQDVMLEIESKLQIVLQELADCPYLPLAPNSTEEEPPATTVTRGRSRAKSSGSGNAAKRSSRSRSRPSSNGRGKK